MDINEAYEKLKVTEAEKKAAQHYFGFAHTSINLLSDLDPIAYCELNRRGWLLDESREDLQQNIKTFVDIYSLMYKESANSKGRRGLVRGTSTRRARALTGSSKQFLSTSMDENIAKRFCEYGDAALVRISIGDGVPHLYADDYKEAISGADEQELIIAPFTKIKDNRFVSRWDGYEYYGVSIEKGELQEKSQEEIDSLMTQVLDGFEQNVTDMKNYVSLSDRVEILKERLQRTTDDEERTYIGQELDKADKESYEVWKRTYDYKNKLNGLLQGMCREKEKEINEARDAVEQDREQKRKDAEAQKKEEERLGAILDFKFKIDGALQTSGRIPQEIQATYQQLLATEKTYREFASRFGLGVSGSIEQQLGASVTSVNSLIKAAGRGLEKVQIAEDSTVEQTKEKESQYARRIAGIDAGMQIANTLKEVTEIYSVQAEDTIKRDLYFKMDDLMKKTKLTLLQQQSIRIKDEKASIFDGITGKSQLRQMRLQNIDLQMQLISRTKPEAKSYYSIHDMLAEMYAFSQTELGGNYTPEIGKLYNAMRREFRTTSGNPISDGDIQQRAKPKIEEHQRQNLPAVPKKGFRLFGKIKGEMEYLQVQNSQLQTQVSNIDGKDWKVQLQPPTKPATEIFKQRLIDIVHNIDADEGPTKTPDKTRDDTVDLWQ